VALPVLVFQHAAVRLPPPVERPLRLLLVTPQMHLVHHSCERLETDSNYSTFLSLWDRVFGTYRNAVPVALGLNGYDMRSSQTVIGMIATPWRDPVETGSSRTSSP
jgi:sterol desaturase/sphingolipid hydroxylase (fatty acid hydroxylase superfamily)